jgi:hypothetical protein
MKESKDTDRMKSSEAKPLSAEELRTLQSLFQRWVLRTYPYHDGSSECSDALQTYYSVRDDAKRGNMREEIDPEELMILDERIKEDGEMEL